MDFKDLINRVRAIHQQFPREYDGKTQLINLMEEVGELSNAVLVNEGDKPVKRQRAHLNDSFADTLFALIVTADSYSVNLEEVLMKALDEIEARQKEGDYQDE